MGGRSPDNLPCWCSHGRQPCLSLSSPVQLCPSSVRLTSAALFASPDCTACSITWPKKESAAGPWSSAGQVPPPACEAGQVWSPYRNAGVALLPSTWRLVSSVPDPCPPDSPPPLPPPPPSPQSRPSMDTSDGTCGCAGSGHLAQVALCVPRAAACTRPVSISRRNLELLSLPCPHACAHCTALYHLLLPDRPAYNGQSLHTLALAGLGIKALRTRGAETACSMQAERWQAPNPTSPLFLAAGRAGWRRRGGSGTRADLGGRSQLAQPRRLKAGFRNVLQSNVRVASSQSSKKAALMGLRALGRLLQPAILCTQLRN